MRKWRNYQSYRKEHFYKECVDSGELWLDCPYCESTFFYLEVELDHIEPIAGVGNSSRNNILPVCRNCNQSKSGSPLYGWLIRKKISPEAVFVRLKKLDKEVPKSMLYYLGY